MPKLIAFDLDGTLIDSRLDLAGAVNYMRSSMGLEPVDAERIVHFIGGGASSLVRRAIADAEIDFDQADISIAVLRSYNIKGFAVYKLNNIFVLYKTTA